MALIISGDSNSAHQQLEQVMQTFIFLSARRCVKDKAEKAQLDLVVLADVPLPSEQT